MQSTPRETNHKNKIPIKGQTKRYHEKKKEKKRNAVKTGAGGPTGGARAGGGVGSGAQTNRCRFGRWIMSRT